MSSLRVVYIVGKGRSGSTLLDDLLGTLPGVAPLGEVRLVWKRGFDEGYVCTCGALLTDCPVWRPAVEAAIGVIDPRVLDATNRLQDRVMTWPHVPAVLLGARPRDDRRWGQLMGRLYAGLANLLRASTLVDSSKWPMSPGILGLVPDVEPWVLHLVRDPRAVAHSWRQHKGGVGQPELPRFGAIHTSLSWTARNVAAELARRYVPPERQRLLRYEDLVERPREVTRDLGAWLDVADPDRAFLDDRTIHLGEAHLVGGNPRRLERGDIVIQADAGWSTGPPTTGRWIVEALTRPLLSRYGYPATARKGSGGG
jgi:Sulfotransferase family